MRREWRMNMTDKNGQPSMEEILASIRRIIAEEPAIPHSNGVLRGTPITLKGDGVLDDASDFDLPAIFRSSPPTQVERAPLLGRLSDAIRNATSTQSESRGHLNGGSRSDDHAPHAEAEGTGENGYAALSSLRSVRPGEGAGEQHQASAALSTPDAGHYAPQPQPAPYVAAAGKPGAPEEPRRVMAPF